MKLSPYRPPPPPGTPPGEMRLTTHGPHCLEPGDIIESTSAANRPGLYHVTHVLSEDTVALDPLTPDELRAWRWRGRIALARRIATAPWRWLLGLWWRLLP